MNTFIYMRISTKEERGLQKYNRQEKALSKYLREQNINDAYWFKEDASGKNFNDRREWNRLEKLLDTGDTIVFKDISRFTREAENGYKKYMELLNNGIELIFIDNQTISTPYIKQLLNIAEEQNLVARTSLESTVKLLLIVELDRAEQERKILINRIKNGIEASEKKQGRKTGTLDKLSDSLKADIIRYLNDRNIKQVDLMRIHKVSKNTISKYIKIIKAEQKQNNKLM